MAVIGGSRVTMPYAMAVMGHAMLRECFQHRRPTLGEVLLHAKREMLSAKSSDANRRVIDLLARVMNLHSDLAAERAEHLLLFNLLGDPLLRLPHPKEVRVRAPETVEAGKEITVEGHCALDGFCTVELVVRRDRLTFNPTARSRYVDDDDALAKFQEVYQKANDPRLASVTVPLRNGMFQTRLKAPASARGPCHVRVFVQSEQGVGIGSSDVQITAPPQVKKPPVQSAGKSAAGEKTDRRSERR